MRGRTKKLKREEASLPFVIVACVMAGNLKQAAIYCRVACADKNTIEAQRLSLHRLAKSLGCDSYIEYLDNGASVLTLERPAFSQMIADIQAGIISFVLVKDIARISRDISSFRKWMDEMDKLGVTVMSANDGLLTAPGNEYTTSTKF